MSSEIRYHCLTNLARLRSALSKAVDTLEGAFVDNDSVTMQICEAEIQLIKHDMAAERLRLVTLPTRELTEEGNQ